MARLLDRPRVLTARDIATLRYWRCLVCDAQLPLAMDVTYYVSKKRLRWYVHPRCVAATWVRYAGGWTHPSTLRTLDGA